MLQCVAVCCSVLQCVAVFAVWERGEDGENVDSWATMVQYEVQQPGMGLLRLVGSLKLQVSFAKEPSKRDHILQKKPII